MSPAPVVRARSGRRATPPSRAPADSHRRSSIRRPGTGRWRAGTTRSPSAAVAVWRTPGRCAPSPHSETPGPTMRTTDTPTCRASESRRRCAVPSSCELRPFQRAAGGVGCGRVAHEPAVNVVVVVLLRPEQPGKGLTLRRSCSSASSAGGCSAVVESVRLGDAAGAGRVEIGKRFCQRLRRKSEPRPSTCRPAGTTACAWPASLLPCLPFDAVALAADHGIVDAVLHVRRRIGRVVDPLANSSRSR